MTLQQFMPVISSLTPVTTVLPLIFVLLVSGIKDLVDDYVSRNVFHNTPQSVYLFCDDSRIVSGMCLVWVLHIAKPGRILPLLCSM